jgi:hypothetical protein
MAGFLGFKHDDLPCLSSTGPANGVNFRLRVFLTLHIGAGKSIMNRGMNNRKKANRLG